MRRVNPNSFEAWLEALSLDAAVWDTIPNLDCIPIAELRQHWAEGCAPMAEAFVNFALSSRRVSSRKRHRPAAGSGARIYRLAAAGSAEEHEAN